MVNPSQVTGGGCSSCQHNSNRGFTQSTCTKEGAMETILCVSNNGFIVYIIYIISSLNHLSWFIALISMVLALNLILFSSYMFHIFMEFFTALIYMSCYPLYPPLPPPFYFPIPQLPFLKRPASSALCHGTAPGNSHLPSLTYPHCFN